MKLDEDLLFWKRSPLDDTSYHPYPDGSSLVYFPARFTGSSMTRPCEVRYDSLGKERWFRFVDNPLL